jgi:hypothetical protein
MGATRILAAGSALLALAACSVGSDGSGGLRQSLGLAAPPPDEFLVVSRRPLEAPPDFNSLPQPRPGAPSRVDPDPEAEARAALLGEGGAGGAGGASASETAILSAAGAATLEPVDRAAIAAAAPPPERRFGLDSFFGFEISQSGGDPDRLDSREEAERLRAQGVQPPAPPPAEE